MFCRLLLKYVHTLRHIDILNLGVVIAIELLFIVFISRQLVFDLTSNSFKRCPFLVDSDDLNLKKVSNSNYINVVKLINKAHLPFEVSAVGLLEIGLECHMSMFSNSGVKMP